MSILEKIFKKKQLPSRPSQLLVNGRTEIFNPFNGDAYSNDIFRSAVDSIARNTAKLKGIHIITNGNSREKGNSEIERILQVRPNPYMTAYDLLYKLVTHYFLYNNAFAYLEKDDKGNLVNIYPLMPQSMEYLIDGANELYCKFLFNGTREVILPFKEVFTIRRFFNSNDLLGDTNQAIMPILNLAHAQNEGLENGIKAGQTIRGILKYSQVLAPLKLKEEKEAFVNDYMNITNAGGIAALDGKADYVPITINPTQIDEKQMQAIKEKIYGYLGISEKIVNSTYDENEWNSFFESVIEPLSLQMSLELTYKIFTGKEQEHGNKIIFESNRLNYSSNRSKTKMISELVPLGLLTINQALEILNMPPVENGDKRLQTLNMVNADIVDKYQMDEEDRKEEEEL